MTILSDARAKLNEHAQPLRRGDWRDAARTAGELVWSTGERYGLRRDLTIPHEPPGSGVPIWIRPLVDDDVDRLLSDGDGDPRSMLRQRRLVRSGLQRCYVAVLDDGDPCFMQWLITSDDNDRMRRVFGPVFPRLDADQVLLEAAFTPRRHRGMGIAGHAMSLITDRAPSHTREAWTFVEGLDRPGRPRPATRAGFAPATVRRFRRRFGVTLVDFRPFDAG